MTLSQTVGKRDSSKLLYIVPDWYSSSESLADLEEALSYEFPMPSKLVQTYEHTMFSAQRIFTLRGNELWVSEEKLGTLHAVPDYVGRLLKRDYVRTSQGWWVLCREGLYEKR